MLAEYSGLVLLLSFGVAWAAGLHLARRRAPDPPTEDRATPAFADETHADSAAASRAEPRSAEPAPGEPGRVLALAVSGSVFVVAVLLLSAWVASFGALGAFGFGVACVFAAPLAVALAYAWRKGALQW